MNAHQIVLVRSSFAQIQPIADRAATLFYANLFEADPSLRFLFRGNMTQQGERLMSMIGSALGMLDKGDALLTVLRSLGARHTRYGVEDRHYDTVGSALLKTLRQGLGEAYTDDVHHAWVNLYAIITRSMKEGALAPAPAIA